MHARTLSPVQPYVANLGRCGLHLEYAMLTTLKAAYVDPFDRICHGLGRKLPQLQTRKKLYRFYQNVKNTAFAGICKVCV